MEQYICYLSILHKMNKVEAIHIYFPGLQDVIPCKDYGNYLFIKSNSSITFLPYSKMETKNPFLDTLNKNRFIIQKEILKRHSLPEMERKQLNIYKSSLHIPN